MLESLDKQELQHILGGFSDDLTEDKSNCNGVGNCSTCKKGCQSSCITGQTGNSLTPGDIYEPGEIQGIITI